MPRRSSRRKRTPVLKPDEPGGKEKPPNKKAKTTTNLPMIPENPNVLKQPPKRNTTEWIEFQSPELKQVGKALFPPTIHWSNDPVSLLLRPTEVTASGTHCKANIVHSPVLTESEVRLWRHKIAAQHASRHRQFPFSKYRLLGIITRNGIEHNEPLPEPCTYASLCHPYTMDATGEKLHKLKASKALKLATNEAEQGLISESLVYHRSTQIEVEWSNVLNKGQYKSTLAPWNADGNVIPTYQEKDYICPSLLLRWLPNHHELIPILTACRDLSEPSALWEIPLLLAYPILTQPRSDEHHNTYDLRMGIYLHRMLPEVTTSSLKVILDALDENSYRVTRPCASIPKAAQPVFQSSQYPVVELDVFDEHYSDNDDETNSQESETNKRDRKEDGALMEGEVENKERISAFSTAGLLKLLEDTGTDMRDYKANHSKYIQDRLKVSLMLHQEHAIAWMLQMEEIELNQLLWEEREFWDGGKYYSCPDLGQIRLDKPSDLRGGLLCDEMGLGKTIEVLGLIVATLPALRQEARDEGTNHATLIVVPPALVAQWIYEISNCIGQDLVVDYYDFRSGETVRRLGKEDEDADVVLTTYNALDQPKSAKALHGEHWGRIVLDEMQEIRSTTTQIAKTCEKLSGSRRWMLSGTPLFDGIADLRGELNFLRLEPFAADNEDGFFDFMIRDPWDCRHSRAIDTLRVLSSVLLRRSKSMSVVSTGLGLLDSLLPLTVQFVPVEQKASERALYYFLESIVAKETKDDATGRHHSLCLRLLRELCVSPMLLNGGMGVKSQLRELNRLVIDQCRRSYTPSDSMDEECGADASTLSPKEAIVYLAQFQETTRTGANEASGLKLGFGQGLSKRARALEGLDVKLKDTEEALTALCHDLEKHRRNRSKARWHWALEVLTSGVHVIDGGPFVPIWRWRYALRASKLPITGWRPTSFFRQHLASQHNFYWSQKNSFRLENIPNVVTVQDLTRAVAQVLLENGNSDSLELACNQFFLEQINSSNLTWNASLVFHSDVNSKLIDHQASKQLGIFVTNDSEKVPLIESNILETKQRFDSAGVIYNVNPTDYNRRRRKEAQRDYAIAKEGLLIVRASQDSTRNIRLLKPLLFRDNAQDPSTLLIKELRNRIENCCRSITALSAKEAALQKSFNRFSGLSNGESHVASAFETLQALAAGETVKTICCICLNELGESESYKQSFGSAKVSMTKCGHLYCRGCLDIYFTQITDHRQMNCPSCRKPIAGKNDVLIVDPQKTDKAKEHSERSASLKIVAEASSMLAKSNGRLLPHMWEHLYRSIELPDAKFIALDGRVSALPDHFLSHMRVCASDLQTSNGDPLMRELRDSAACPIENSSCLASKIKALLKDLPGDERSVVFATANATIKHLSHVLESVGIGFRALYSGQNVSETERSIDEWQSRDDAPVLLVQSGPAASGLTLTASCKMFLLEPFLRLSEEQQAYGRCHRFGQEKPVHVTTYFSPISVESRLLEWRKRAARKGPESDTNVVYVDEESESDDSDVEDQTRFLLNMERGYTDDIESD